ncbi:MAG: DUF4142 domain-containing protein [Rhizomicrobium sp.]|jgi:putative membrane protein
MRLSLLAVPVMASALVVPAFGNAASAAMAPGGDAGFVRTAAISDMYEIQASQLAQTKATSADVKSFASRMVTDHTKTSDQLKSLLAKKPGMSPPTALDSRHRLMLAKLRGASGPSFDRLYAQQQLQAHQQAVLLFTNESQNANDPDLKNFARETLPALQQHLSMAQQLPKGGAAP